MLKFNQAWYGYKGTTVLHPSSTVIDIR